MRDHRGEPGTGSEHDPVGGERSTSTATPGRPAGRPGCRCTERTSPVVLATCAWPRMQAISSGLSGSSPMTSASISSGTEAIGSTRPLAAEQPGHHVQAGDRVAQPLPEPGDQQVADRVVAQRPGAGEAVLQHVGPGPAGLVVTAQRGQRHPQVARRQAVELGAQPAGGAAVVGHRDDRGQPVGDPPQSAERRGQAVPAAERDDRGQCTAEAGGTPRQPAPVRAVLTPGPGPGAAPWSAGRRRGAGGRTPRPSPCCGACRRCSRWRS